MSVPSLSVRFAFHSRSLPFSLSLCCQLRVCREYPCHYIHPPATLTLVVKTHAPIIDLSLSLSSKHCARILIHSIWTSKTLRTDFDQSRVVFEAETDGVEFSSAESKRATLGF